MEASRTPTSTIWFGDFELLTDSGEFEGGHAGAAFWPGLRHARPVGEARGKIVSREELQRALWANSSLATSSTD